MESSRAIKNGKYGSIKFDQQRTVPFMILIIMIIALSVARQNFLQFSTFRNLLQSVAATGIVAVGAMFVLITGGIDFTAGYGLSTAAVSAGVLYVASGNNMFVLMIAGIVFGTIIGMINGAIISKLNMPPFIATFAMMSVLQGMALLISEGKQIMITDSAARFIGQGVVFGWLPVSFLIFLAVCFLGYILLNRTKMGVYLYAMGGNENSAVYAGVNLKKYKFLVYTFAGFCTGIASVVTCSRVSVVSSSLSGDILMDGIASAVIGGTSVSGGKGTISGTIAGVLIMGLVSASLTYLNVDTLLRDVVKGGVIIAALLVDTAINRRE